MVVLQNLIWRPEAKAILDREGPKYQYGAGCISDGVFGAWLARLCGVEPGVKIVPFRGEYYELVPERQSLMKNLIYPVPDPAFPFPA